MFSSVLVANRGEIAVRIIRTLRTMGIRAVLAASVPDRRGLAARSADEVIVLEGYSAAETYLEIDLVIAAAKSTGCEAIHPGYGFLSERADFAERCATEGIVFIGPPPGVLRALGDKSAARTLAIANGIPVVPGYDGPDDAEALAGAAATIGFPVMVKARGGGGGRGMREVHHPGEFPGAAESARREAESAFGDGRLLLEKLVTQAHHVEVQVLADTHGNFVHLGERDCSVQRRRQKLIEESPSPVVDDALRERLTDAALRIARAAGYVNAGTVEFLVGQPDESGVRPFYFLEVNPRLQVEHPVTEMRTGLDLVELQLRIASGDSLPFSQTDIKFEGHAIEVRINAEDPWNDFRPSSGRSGSVQVWADRLDVGFVKGDAVPAQYDSLLAKAVFKGGTRVEALEDCAAGLWPVEGDLKTNFRFLQAAVRQPAFLAGEATVDWLETALPSVLDAASTPAQWWEAAADTIRDAGTSLWLGAGERVAWLSDGRLVRSTALGPGGRSPDWHDPVAATFGTAAEPGSRRCHVRDLDDLQRPEIAFRFVPPPPLPRRPQAAAAGATLVTAPLSGTVSSVRVDEGDSVEAGQVLVLLEAMKMEHRITADSPGTVARVAARQGDVVREGDILVELSPPDGR